MYKQKCKAVQHNQVWHDLIVCLYTYILGRFLPYQSMTSLQNISLIRHRGARLSAQKCIVNFILQLISSLLCLLLGTAIASTIYHCFSLAWGMSLQYEDLT